MTAGTFGEAIRIHPSLTCPSCGSPIEQLFKRELPDGSTRVTLRCHGQERTVRVPIHSWLPPELFAKELAWALGPPTLRRRSGR